MLIDITGNKKIPSPPKKQKDIYLLVTDLTTSRSNTWDIMTVEKVVRDAFDKKCVWRVGGNIFFILHMKLDKNKVNLFCFEGIVAICIYGMTYSIHVNYNTNYVCEVLLSSISCGSS